VHLSRYFALALLGLLVAAPALAANCGDRAGPGKTDIPCSCGDTVVTSTRLTGADPVVYSGGGDTVCADQGLVIGADRVRLVCENLELRGDGSGNGVESTGFNGVRVERCVLREFLHGVRASDCGSFRSSDNLMTSNIVNGLLMTSCHESRVSSSVAEDNNGNGIELIDCSASSVKDTVARSNNGNGIDLQNSRGNTLSGNVSEDNDQDNLELGDSVNNVVKGNLFQRATFAGIHILSNSSHGNVFRKNTLAADGTFDVHNGSIAGDNNFTGNGCASSLGPDVDCP
jgi:parallel beta-helix repeat protein